MFGWIKDTKAGKIMKEWSEVFQPVYDDISRWKDIKDIGKFSDKAMKEMKEAWATVPKPAKKDLYKAYKLIIKHVPELAVQIVRMFFELQGKKIPS